LIIICETNLLSLVNIGWDNNYQIFSYLHLNKSLARCSPRRVASADLSPTSTGRDGPRGVGRLLKEAKGRDGRQAVEVDMGRCMAPAVERCRRPAGLRAWTGEGLQAKRRRRQARGRAAGAFDGFGTIIRNEGALTPCHSG